MTTRASRGLLSPSARRGRKCYIVPLPPRTSASGGSEEFPVANVGQWRQTGFQVDSRRTTGVRALNLALPFCRQTSEAGVDRTRLPVEASGEGASSFLPGCLWCPWCCLAGDSIPRVLLCPRKASCHNLLVLVSPHEDTIQWDMVHTDHRSWVLPIFAD